MSDPRPEWIIADFAILTGGYVSVPIYPTLPAAQMRYILADSSARVAVVADDVQAEKIISVWAELSNLRAVVVMDPGKSNNELEQEILNFDSLQARGHQRLSFCHRPKDWGKGLELPSPVRPHPESDHHNRRW